MLEEIKTTETAPVTEIKTETKTAPATTETAKAIPAKTEVVDNKTAPTTETKTETKAETPAEELKSLLDEAGEEKTEKKEGEAKVVPEKYDIKLPEGMTLDEASMAIVSPVFKALGLDNAQAQKLVDLNNQLIKSNQEKFEQAFDQHVQGLKKEAKEYFGIKLPEVMRNVARARDMYMPKSADGKEHPLQDKLNVSGLSNDKDVLEFFDKVGRTIGEGKFVDGKRSAPAKGDGSVEIAGPSLKDVYPSMSKK